MPIGSADRIIAEKRPSAASALILRRILKRWRMTAGQVLQDFAQIAAGRALDRDRGDEQRQVVLADAEIEVAHRRLEIGAVGDLVGDDAEFGADRVGHLARHHRDRDRHRMAGAQAAHDDVDGVGKLRAELLLAALAHESQHQDTAARARRRAPRQRGLDDVAAQEQHAAEHDDVPTPSTIGDDAHEPDASARTAAPAG